MDAVTETGVRPRQLGLAYIEADKVLPLIKKEPHVFDLVEKACGFSGDRFDAYAVVQACAGADPNWHPQLWIAGFSGGGEKPTLDSVAITLISNFTTGLRVFEVALVAGESAQSWLQFEDVFVAFAKRQGCSRIQMIGRRGWQRLLPKYWRESARMFERHIDLGEGPDGPN